MKTFGQLSYHYAIDCQGAILRGVDIRYKGAHIEGGNTGVIGIVFLADFSVRGEAGKYGPGAWNVMKKRGLASIKGTGSASRTTRPPSFMTSPPSANWRRPKR